ncbi:hypothetical protein [Streptomyces justiciae]|uniref:hypothetical protein n=1 Tax=Streptomyces justiciae TaxID=2780140 RepID=UPI0018825977|nr:hypothetical protein [Streptomyces justiciae]MBE8477565.1 hypothetical protein [Streptomyces justiciae]
MLTAVTRALCLSYGERDHLFALARTPSADFGLLPYRQRNSARYALLDPAARDLLETHRKGLRAGRVVADAAVGGIMSRAVLAAVYETTVGVREIDGTPVALCYGWLPRRAVQAGVRHRSGSGSGAAIPEADRPSPPTRPQG